MSNYREKIETGLQAFGRTIYRNPLKTLLIMLALMAALFSQLPRLKLDTSTEAFFHRSDPALITYEAFREQFGRDEVILVAVRPPEVFDRAFLEKLRAFHRAIEEEVPFLRDVTSLINVRNTRGEGDRLIVEDLLEELPTTPEEMADLRRRVLASSLYPNFFISEDGRFTTLVLETLAFSPGDEPENPLAAFDQEEPAAPAKPILLTNEENNRVVTAVKSVSARFAGPNFEIFMAGSPVWSDFLLRAMPRDMSRFMALAALSIGLFLFVLFRRVSGVVLPLMVVVLSLLSTISLMAASGTPLTVPTTILPSFLLAVGVGASVHVLSIFFREFQQHGDKEAAIVNTLGHSGLPVIMTGLTTAAGLFSFTTAALAPVAHLGIFGGVGALISLVYTLVLIPALLALWPVRQVPRFGGRRLEGGFDRLLGGIADFATGHAKGVVAVSALVVVLAAVGLKGLIFSHNPVAWIPRSHEVRRDLDLIDRELKGSVTVEVVVDTGKENGLYDPAVMRNLASLSRFAEQLRNKAGKQVVGKTNSIVDVLRETHQALNENRPEFYAIPGSRELIAQELLLFENSGSDDLEKLVDSRFRKARLTTKVLNDDAAAYVSFVASLQEEAERLFAEDVEITVTGLMKLFTGVIVNLMRSMVQSYSIAAVVITVMMIQLLGSFRIGLLSMIPNLGPILITLGLMGWTGIRLDGFTLLIGSIALGLAVDDTIHFFHNFRRYYVETGSSREAVRQTLLTSGRAMLFTSLVLVTGFWLFMFATLNNVFFFGLLTGTTLILALLADFLLAPAMLELITRTETGRRIMARWGGAPVGA